MSWSINLPTAFGIPIRVHYSFFLLLAWIAFEASAAGSPVLPEVLFIITIFGCVLLHELGHALTALYFGIKTRDIVLYPIGGVASIVKEAPPLQELLITIAGPLVNVVLALLLYPFSSFESYEELGPIVEITIVDRIFFTNILLAVFNLIPAFPMDGGRILRSLLALCKVKSATMIAARVSQLLSIGLGALAVMYSMPIVAIISVFILLNASQTVLQAKLEKKLSGKRVSDIMIPLKEVTSIPHGSSCREALLITAESKQSVFLIAHGEQILGVISKKQLIALNESEMADDYISGYAEKELPMVDSATSLANVAALIAKMPHGTLLVSESGAPVGILTPEVLLQAIS